MCMHVCVCVRECMHVYACRCVYRRIAFMHFYQNSFNKVAYDCGQLPKVTSLKRSFDGINMKWKGHVSINRHILHLPIAIDYKDIQTSPACYRDSGVSLKTFQNLIVDSGHINKAWPTDRYPPSHRCDDASKKLCEAKSWPIDAFSEFSKSCPSVVQELSRVAQSYSYRDVRTHLTRMNTRWYQSHAVG